MKQYEEHPNNLVCVLCGVPWVSIANRCQNSECNGFCSWGEKKDGPPSSWDVTEKGWVPKPVSKEVLDKDVLDKE